MAVKKYINEYGWEEQYLSNGIDHYRTGHISQDDCCGTCDGGKCDFCREVWKVWQMGPTDKNPEPHVFAWEIFESLEEAEEALRAIEEKELV